MNVSGKIIGAALGFFLNGGPLGALFGFFIGHYFDRKRNGQSASRVSAKELHKIHRTYFTSIYCSLGHLAKADGRVSEAEIQYAESVIRHMQLDDEQRQIAINLFQQGKQSDFSLESVLSQLRKACRQQRSLLQMFLEIMIQASLADGQISPSEMQLLQRMAKALGFNRIGLQIMIQRVQAEQYFHQQHQSQSTQKELQQAYRVLELEPDCTFNDVKKAYRRLMAQNHPDKLVAKGLPESMQQIAHEKVLEIQNAFQVIKQHREAQK